MSETTPETRANLRARLTGCGDNSCVVQSPGMGTNGGCGCHNRGLLLAPLLAEALSLLDAADERDTLRAQVEWLRTVADDAIPGPLVDGTEIGRRDQGYIDAWREVLDALSEEP